MMKHDSGTRENRRDNRAALANARTKSLWSSSTLAMGQSLRRAALPCAVVVAAFVFPENGLQAIQLRVPLGFSVQDARHLLMPDRPGPIVQVLLDPNAVVIERRGDHALRGRHARGPSVLETNHRRDPSAPRPLDERFEDNLVALFVSRGTYRPAPASLDLDFVVPAALDSGLKSLSAEISARLRTIGSEFGQSEQSAAILRGRLSELSGILSAPLFRAPTAEMVKFARAGSTGSVRRRVDDAGPRGKLIQGSDAYAHKPSIPLEIDAVLTRDSADDLQEVAFAGIGTIFSDTAKATSFAWLPNSVRIVDSRWPDLVSAADAWLGTRPHHSLDHDVINEESQETGPSRKADSLGGTSSLLPDALIDPSGATLVRLGSVIEILKDKFSNEELRRLRASSQTNRYVPLRTLQSEGIPIGIGQATDMLEFDASLMQSASEPSGSSGSGSGARFTSGGGTLKKSLIASVSAGFDSNPFLSPRQNSEAPSLRLQLAPTLSREDARSTVRASGRFEHLEYLGRYGSLQNFGADLVGVHKTSERLAFNGGLLFRSEILATDLTNPLNGENAANPLIPIRPGGNDVTLLGQRQRRIQYGADAGAQYTPSARDEIRWSLSYRGDRFATGQLSDSDFYSQQLRYSRQISEAISIGAVVDASIIEFSNAAFGNARTVTPQALLTAKLSDRLRATGSVGVAVTTVELASGKERTTAFAGNASICYGATRSSLCITGARQVLPSAIGGASVQTTGGIAYSLRLSERDTVQIGGNYSTASQPLALVGADFESINAFGRYERKLNERMRLYANAGYIDTSGNIGMEASNVQAVLGISVSFGKDR